MKHPSNCDHVVSEGTLENGSARVDYYTTSPAPSQWTAVGVLIRHTSAGRAMHRQLLVGNGRTEKSAIGDLSSKFIQMVTPALPDISAEPDGHSPLAGGDRQAHGPASRSLRVDPRETSFDQARTTHP